MDSSKRKKNNQMDKSNSKDRNGTKVSKKVVGNKTQGVSKKVVSNKTQGVSSEPKKEGAVHKGSLENTRKDGRVKRKDSLTEEEIAKKKKRRKRRLICLAVAFLILLIMFLVSLHSWSKIIKDVVVCENSLVLDSTGNVIAVLGESRIQEVVPFDKIPKNLVNAYVAIEDKNFYKHHGINIKRTGGAILSYITHKGAASYGGSTITQQLIKNITGESETSISRKVTEWDRAIKTEMLLSKDEIMHTYLNIIYVGPNIYGVEMGARYYFDKSVSDLDLAECAFLAGLNHSPNSYNPFGEKDNEEKIKLRCKTVLGVMLDEKLVSNSEYNEAVEKINKGLNFKKGDVSSKGDGIYSYMVDATISEVVADLEKNKKMSSTFATNYLYYSGLKIYCTQNSDIQKDIEEEFSKPKYMVRSSQNEGQTAQAAMVVIDHENGQVKGCVRWLGRKEIYKGI